VVVDLDPVAAAGWVAEDVSDAKDVLALDEACDEALVPTVRAKRERGRDVDAVEVDPDRTWVRGEVDGDERVPP
jgi:hypothetical protein